MNIDKSQVERQFNRSAALYDSVAGMQRDIVDTLIRELPDLNQTYESKVCDIGCGTGYGLSRLAAQFPNSSIVGLDLAPAMLQAAAARLAAFDQAANDIDLIQGDIESLPFKASSMDLCFSSSAMQWCDADATIEQISNTLKPGGCALLSSFLSGTLQAWRQIWGGENEQTFLSFERFNDLFLDSSLIIDRIWSERHVQAFESFESAVASIRHLGAGNAGNSRAKGLMGRDRLQHVTSQVNSIIEQEGSIELVYHVVYVKATKIRN